MTTGSESSLGMDKGHRFISVASFPWNDRVNGPRVQSSAITVNLQSKALGNSKEITIQGSIKLNSYQHTTAERFKLDSFKITVLALHGKSDSRHPIECNRMSPGTEETRTSGFTIIAPSPSSVGQIQYTTSTRRTHLGTSITADLQLAHEFTLGTVWFQRVEDPGQGTFGGPLGSFSARFINCCEENAGCSAADPTSLAITINANLSDSNPDASAKALVQTVHIQYPDWPDLDDEVAGETIHTTYNTDFRGSEVEATETKRGAANRNKLPEGITYTMDVNRGRNSGFRGHVATTKVAGTMNTVAKTIKAISKQVRHPSSLLDLMYDRSAQSGSSTKLDHP